MDVTSHLAAVGLSNRLSDGDLVARSPIDGSVTAASPRTTPARVDAAIGRAHAAFLAWRAVPAPRRGELIRLFGEELRASKDALARARHASRPARSSPRRAARCRR